MDENGDGIFPAGGNPAALEDPGRFSSAIVATQQIFEGQDHQRLP